MHQLRVGEDAPELHERVVELGAMGGERPGRDRAGAQKRGSGEAALPIGVETDTSPGLQIEDTAASNPEHEFDRAWAVALLQRALNALARGHLNRANLGKLVTIR